MNITGKRIKQRRIELGWSLRELAKQMGYANQSTISRIESGAIDIPQSKVVKFAQVMGTTVAFLMGWDEEEKKPTDNDGLSQEMTDLFNRIKNLPPDKVQLLLQLAKSIE